MQRILSYLAIVLVAVAASYGVSKYVGDSQRTQRLAVCQNENKIVARLNRHTVANQQRIVMILRHFTFDAAAARQASYDRAHHRTDLIAARQYREQNHDLRSLRIPRYDPLNCVHNA